MNHLLLRLRPHGTGKVRDESALAAVRRGTREARPCGHSESVATVSRSIIVQGILIAASSLAFGDGAADGKKFTPEAAAALNAAEARECLKHDSRLHFSNLANLQPEVAAIIATHKHGVDLPALQNINPQTAAALATATSHLSMNGLVRLDDQSAAALSGCKAHLEVEGLQDLTSVPLASRLAMQGKVELPNIKGLHRDVLQGFCVAPCDLYLHGIVALQQPAAEVLKHHQGVLDIDNLQNPPPDVLVCILGNQGPLGLGSITSLGDPTPPEVLRALEQHPGSLCLNGLKDLTRSQAEAISKRKHRTDLWGVANLTPEVAKALVNCDSIITLTGVVQLQPEIVKTLLQHKPDPGTGFVFSTALHGNLLSQDAKAFDGHVGLHFGNEYSP
jgi:hypothetical protein